MAVGQALGALGGGVGSAASTAASMAGDAAAVAGGAAQTVASSAASDAFLGQITAMQLQANSAALTNAKISNEKALTDALGKNIKGTGESVKNLGAQ